MNTSTGEGTTSGWNARLQSIPSREAQLAIERAYRTMGRPFSRPQHWDDAVAVPWQSGATTVVRDVRVADSEPRRDNSCRVVDTLGRNGKRILPQRTRAGDGLLPPPSGKRILPRRTHDEDEDMHELAALVRRFLRENSSSTEDHESNLQRQEDSIPARSYRDVWGRPENAGARHLRAADERTKAMDSRSLSFHDQLRAQSLLSGPCAFGEDR